MHADLPNLLGDTWQLRAEDVDPSVFGTHKTRTVRCSAGSASINPQYPLGKLADALRGELGGGVPARSFALQYGLTVDSNAVERTRRRRARPGLRVLVVLP
jgi:hypothetical protein